MVSLGVLLHDEQLNAGLAWLLTAVMTLVAIGSLAAGHVLWAAFSTVVVAVAVLPALVTLAPTATAPWPLLLVAVASITTGAVGRYPEAAGAFAVTALALLSVAELDTFTRTEMSRRFAVVVAVLTTLALQGLWIVGQYVSDRRWGTSFLTTQAELQRDIVMVTVVATVSGSLFALLFRRFGDTDGQWQSPSSEFDA